MVILFRGGNTTYDSRMMLGGHWDEGVGCQDEADGCLRVAKSFIGEVRARM